MVATEEPPAQQQHQAMPENTGAFGKIKATLLTAQDKGKPVIKVRELAADAEKKRKSSKPKKLKDNKTLSFFLAGFFQKRFCYSRMG
jgi:hypothetical protein